MNECVDIIIFGMEIECEYTSCITRGACGCEIHQSANLFILYNANMQKSVLSVHALSLLGRDSLTFFCVYWFFPPTSSDKDGEVTGDEYLRACACTLYSPVYIYYKFTFYSFHFCCVYLFLFPFFAQSFIHTNNSFSPSSAFAV